MSAARAYTPPVRMRKAYLPSFNMAGTPFMSGRMQIRHCCTHASRGSLRRGVLGDPVGLGLGKASRIPHGAAWRPAATCAGVCG